MINFSKTRLPGRGKGVHLFLTGVALFILCTVPAGPGAQQLNPVVTYEGSISDDEEQVRLILPSFVYAEPGKKEVYLIDGKGRILIFTSDLFPLFTLTTSNRIESPQGLTVDDEGYLYVAQGPTKDIPKSRISVFSPCLKWERDIYLKGFEGAESFLPYRIAVDKKKNLYVASNHFSGALYLNNQGKFLSMITPEEDGEAVMINNIFRDAEGKLYLLSEIRGRVYVYDEDRTFIMKFGEKGGSSGKLSLPKAVAVDSLKGRTYVVDYMRHTINVYNTQGEFVFEFGGRGWGDGWFQHPVDLSIDPEGRILIADMFNHRIQVFHSW